MTNKRFIQWHVLYLIIQKNKRKLYYLGILHILLLISITIYGQDPVDLSQDSAKTVIMLPATTEIITRDSVEQQREDSPLDITSDRGLYIMADEGKLQMRILGSIRFSAYYDNKNLQNKNTFSTFDIPTGNQAYKVPNYFNSLNFSRIGFEIKRKTTGGDFFIRLETDFAGPESNYRIRHAYGQYRNFLIGQSWSLLSNVSSLPATVDPNGPVGTITSRTPQIRFNSSISDRLLYAVAVEYSLPDYISSDTINITFVQTIPNLTARINSDGKLGSLQLSGIIAPITGIDPNGNRDTSFGFGSSLSGTLKLHRSDQLLFQATYGKAINHFMNPFQGKGQDMAYNPETSTFNGLNTAGGFLSYGHIWPKDISSYLSFGIASIINRSYQSEDSFNYSYSFSGNAFWKIVEGMRVGLEYMYGRRYNIDDSTGKASRIWALFYYDF
jgi:hypothetical protein